jgi:hypothetical protein
MPRPSTVLVVVAAAAAGSLAAPGFAACTGGSRPSSETVRPAPSDDAPRLAEAVAPSPPASVPSALAHPGPSATAAADPSRCDSPRARIVNAPPDAGVVFNNAMTAADAGHIDRTRGVIDTLAAAATAFRCCFDAWDAGTSGAEGWLMLRVVLDPDGAVREATTDPRRSTIDAIQVAQCVADVARGLDYPPSPTGKQTTVEYPFRIALP